MSQELTQSLGYSLSKDTETEGFDLQAGQTWIYPTNYPIRDYQYNIIQEALLKNTLVSLPTGLGKTFIAAVVMYNFYRWYPLGKVIFMAPTRPLVKQQIDACYDIMAIPKDVTVELTGSKMINSREKIWKDKRVFFITPQILQNDLDTLTELGPKIKCLVFDEAHRARGNHAYCEVIRKLKVHNKFFRVLALSATPGSSISDVLEVVQNLLISHLEFRTEESLDVHPYVYERNLTTVVVPLGKTLQKVKDDYLQILEYYTRSLIKYKVIQGNCGNLTKGKIFVTMKEYQQKTRNDGSSNYAEIMKSLNICITLYHAFELLIRHGLRSFLSFFDEHIDKPLLRGNTRLIEIMNDIREYLGPEPNIEQLPDGSYPEIPETTKFGHPKFYKLRDILLSHFTEASESSRVIVFFEYRNSVMEAYTLLFQARPVLKPRIFLGQGHGVTQRNQLNVVKAFREGDCNILLSTCIGEEGLDVGDVDLIVCFDISNKSPIRMVQRMGRTGRTKQGNIIVLVTEGKEQQILKDCLIYKNNIAFHVLSSKALAKGLNYCSPRLIPTDISPKCEKIFITVKKPQLTKNSSLKDMFRTISSSSSEPTFSPDLQIVDIQEKIPKAKILWNKERPLEEDISVSNIFCKRIERQRSLQPIHLVKHSHDSQTLVDLLQLIDSKRFNIPVSQIGSASQLTQSRNLKQSDIRSMFLTTQGFNDVAATNRGTKTKQEETVQEENHSIDSRELFTEISDYLSIRMSVINKKCKHCPDNIDCSMQNINLQNIDFTWIEIPDSILETITTEDLNVFAESLTPNSKKNCKEFEFNDCDIFDNMEITKLEKITESDNNSHSKPSQVIDNYVTDNINVSVPFGEKSFSYQAPKNLDSILSKYSTSIIDITEISENKNEKKYSSDANIKGSKEVNDIDEDHEILEFFKIKTLEELFSKNMINDSQETVVYSPDIFDSTILRETKSVSEEHKSDNKNSDDSDLSPVLCTYTRVKNVKNFRKNILNPSHKEDACREKQIKILKPIATPPRPNLKKLNLYTSIGENNEVDTPSKFTMNRTKISSTPFGKDCTDNRNFANRIKSNSNSSSNLHPKNNTQVQAKELDNPEEEEIKSDSDVEDICDLSIFGLSEPKCKNSSTSDIEELCDLSTFGMVTQQNKRGNNINEANQNIVQNSNCKLTNTKSVNKELLFGSQNKSTDLKKNLEEIIIESPSPDQYCSTAPINKPFSQSQMRITQILDLINEDEEISENVGCNISQKENLELNTNNILNNKVRNEDCSFSNKGENLPKKQKIYVNKTSINSNLSRFTKLIKKGLGKSKNISFNTALNSRNSDDDFEDEQSCSYNKPKPSKIKHEDKKNNKPSSVTVVKKNKNVFIDDEAELSVDENINISEDEEDQDGDTYEISFIADETQDIDTQMHARYLQSIKSPKKKGLFKIPQKQWLKSDVYSQEVNHEHDTYLEDTFVVHEETELTQHELSELEILEQKLKEIKRNKRKKTEDMTNAAKRRRIIQISSDESD